MVGVELRIMASSFLCTPRTPGALAQMSLALENSLLRVRGLLHTGLCGLTARLRLRYRDYLERTGCPHTVGFFEHYLLQSLQMHFPYTRCKHHTDFALQMSLPIKYTCLDM